MRMIENRSFNFFLEKLCFHLLVHSIENMREIEDNWEGED